MLQLERQIEALDFIAENMERRDVAFDRYTDAKEKDPEILDMYKDMWEKAFHATRKLVTLYEILTGEPCGNMASDVRQLIANLHVEQGREMVRDAIDEYKELGIDGLL